MADKANPTYADFSGGLNCDLSPDMVPDNCLTVADNVDLSTGAIRKRGGSVPIGLEGTCPAQTVERVPAAYKAMDTDSNGDGVVDGFTKNSGSVTQVHSVDSAQKVTLADATQTYSYCGVKMSSVPVMPNTEYAFSVETKLVKSAADTESARFEIRWLDADYEGISVKTLLTDDTGENYTELSGVYTSPENAAFAELSFYVRAGAVGATGSAWFKNASLIGPTTTTEVVLASGASSSDDTYNNYSIMISDGTGVGQARSISDYEGAKRLATLSAAWTTKPDATSKYIVYNSYGGEVNRIIEWPRNDGTTEWLQVVTVGAAITLNKTDKTTGALTPLCTLNKADIGWFWWQDKFYFGDGQYYRLYDGTTCRLVRPPKADAPTVANDGDSGNVDCGTHYWMVTFYDGTNGTESQAGAAASAYIVRTGYPGNPGQANLTDIPVGAAGTGTTKRKVYRTKLGDDTKFYLLTTINDNTTATYTDNTADAGLGALYAITTDLVAINRCNRFVYHPYSTRVFAAGDTSDKAALYYSDTGDPTEFRATWKRYPPNSGWGDIQTLGLFADAVTAHWKGGHMRWKGADPATDTTWWQMPVNIGVASPFAVCLVPNALSFLAPGGPYIVSPSALDTSYILQAGDTLVRNIAEDKWASLITGASDLSAACAVYDHIRERYMLAYKAASASTGNDRILVVEWDTQTATVWKGIHANHFCLCADGTLLVASTNYLLKLNQTVFTDVDTADGSAEPVALLATTKEYPLGNPVNKKKLFSVRLTVQAVTSGVLDVTIGGGASDVEKVDASVAAKGVYKFPAFQRGEKFHVDIANDTAQAVKVDSVSFEFITLPPRGKEV